MHIVVAIRCSQERVDTYYEKTIPQNKPRSFFAGKSVKSVGATSKMDKLALPSSCKSQRSN